MIEIEEEMYLMKTIFLFYIFIIIIFFAIAIYSG